MHWLTRTVGILTPRLLPVQMRALIRLGVILRWVAVGFAGLAGLLGPRVPSLLASEILVAIAYNGLVMRAAARASDADLPALALVTTVVDQLFCFTFIGLYNVMPESHQVAAYVPAMIEAVAFFGTGGAILSTGIFLSGVIAAEAITAALHLGPFDAIGVFGSTMIVILIGGCLAAVSQVLEGTAGEKVRSGPRLTTNGAVVNGSALSNQQQDVLRLVARGCSNAMIATQLGMSERMVKACLERLLGQLRARNRAEAVAAAIRGGLL